MATLNGEVLVCLCCSVTSIRKSLPRIIMPRGGISYFLFSKRLQTGGLGSNWSALKCSRVQMECIKMFTQCWRFYINKMDLLLQLKNQIGQHWACFLTLDENGGVSASLRTLPCDSFKLYLPQSCRHLGLQEILEKTELS